MASKKAKAKSKRFEFGLVDGAYSIPLGDSFGVKAALKGAGCALNAMARAWTVTATDKARKALEAAGGKFVGKEAKSSPTAPVAGHKKFQGTLAAYVEAKAAAKAAEARLDGLKEDVMAYVLEHGDEMNSAKFVVEVGYHKCQVSERSRTYLDTKVFNALVDQGKISKTAAKAVRRVTTYAVLNHWDKSPMLCPECGTKASKKSAKFCNECGHRF